MYTKRALRLLSLGLAGIAALALGCVSSRPAPASRPPDGAPRTVASEATVAERLARLEARVDTLYDALQPELGNLEQQARRQREQHAADERLALHVLRHEEDANFTGVLIFLPGTSRLILACRDHSLLEIDPASDRAVRRDLGLPEAVTCMAAAADTLVLGARSGTLYRWTIGAAEALPIASTAGWPIDAVAISPDAQWIACVTAGKSDAGEKWATAPEPLAVFRVADGARMYGAAAGRADFQPVAFARDAGRLLAVRNGDVAVLHAATGAVDGTRAEPAHGAGPLSVACSPREDLAAVGYAPYDIALWDLAQQSRPTLLQGHTNWVVALAFTSDGARLVSGAGDSTARVWDVHGGQEVGRLRVPGPSTYIRTVSVAGSDECAAVGVSGAWWLCRLPDRAASR
jgi:WD40 repeat protein